MSNVPSIRTRFAPSPTGLLHLGHAWSAMQAHEMAGTDGTFILRIEDIDLTRCRPEFEEAIYDDLHFLGLSWEEPVRRQSDHFAEYGAAIAKLTVEGLTYPCFCTRREIAEEIEGAVSAPHGPDGPLYPGTCRTLTDEERAARMDDGLPFALRLDVEKAIALLARRGVSELSFEAPDEEGVRSIPVNPRLFGDIVLARKDVPTSYHVSVVHDDALQGITHVVRGTDLFEATHIQRVLQALWGLPAPLYRHHPLLIDETGRRFAKRDKSLTIRALREAGHDAASIRRMAETAEKK